MVNSRHYLNECGAEEGLKCRKMKRGVGGESRLDNDDSFDDKRRRYDQAVEPSTLYTSKAIYCL